MNVNHFGLKPKEKSMLPGYFDDQSERNREYQASLVRCLICEKGFADQHAVDIHCQRTHGKFLCESCKKGFKTKSSFTKHQKEEHETSEASVKQNKSSDSCGISTIRCETCQRDFKTWAGLTRHNKAFHMENPAESVVAKQQIVKSETLSWKQNSKTVKSNVIKKMDTVLDMFRCPVCPKEFRLKQSLTNHLKSHDRSEEQKLEIKREAKAQKRKNPTFRKEEAEKMSETMAQKRKNPTFRKKEAEKMSETMAQKRKNPTFREEEAEKMSEKMAQKRKNPTFRKEEAEKMVGKRKNPTFRKEENEKKSETMA